MKTLDVGQADLRICVSAAQNEPVVITQSGEPVALVVGVRGLDEEQIELGSSADFWAMIQSRRTEQTINRHELERRISASD